MSTNQNKIFQSDFDKSVSLRDSHRFSDVPPISSRLIAPIEGFESKPLVSLEEALEPLKSIVPRLDRNSYFVKRNCQQPKDGLTTDESASVMLYTFETTPKEESLCMILNTTLRSEQRSKLKPWFLYLRLLIHSLNKLPRVDCSVFRGVRADIHEEYNTGETFIWWPFSSCSAKVETLENEEFLGKTGPRTLFQIHCQTGVDIHNHSFLPNEWEVLLLPAREFIVEGKYDAGNGLHIIQIEEIQPKFALCEMIPPVISPTAKIQPVQFTFDQPKARISTTENLKKRRSENLMEGLKDPYGIVYHDVSETLFVADTSNHRVIAWNIKKKKAHIAIDQIVVKSSTGRINSPTDLVIDRSGKYLYITEPNANRISRWSFSSGRIEQDNFLLENVSCHGLAIDYQNNLYVVEKEKNCVTRYDHSKIQSKVVAGGNGAGAGFNQLNRPDAVVVDDEGNIFVSDCYNHRIVQWRENWRAGIQITGSSDGISYPRGIAIDKTGLIYICNGGDKQGVVVFDKNSKTLSTIVDTECERKELGLSKGVNDLTLDRSGNIYVTEYGSNRVRCFYIE